MILQKTDIRPVRAAGNALLELLVFIPLMLLILFAGLEAALAYSERAAVSGALRSGLNAVRSFEGSRLQQKIEQATADIRGGADSLAETAVLVSVLNDTADEIEYNLLQVRRRDLSRSADSFRIRTAVVETVFDGVSGSPLSCSIVESVDRGDPSFEPAEGDIGAAYITAEEYVSAHCGMDSAAAGELAAAPALYLALNGSNELIQFPNRQYQMYAEINAAVRGLNRELVRSAIGRSFDIREQGMVLLRPAGRLG